jgi:hypothetical protein
MLAFRSGVAAVLFAAQVGVCAAEEPSPVVGSDPALARVLYFSGADFWHTGAFVHGGLLWSPGGITREGFTLKLLAAGGTYTYRSGAREITGLAAIGSVMPGWRFKADKFELTVYGGLDVQNHQLSPDDPGGRLRGGYIGARAGGDLWYEPISGVMVAANASVSTIGPSYWTRIASGLRLFDRVWIGPEAQALGSPHYDQLRLGIHATALKTGDFEWSVGAGFACDSDHRSGFYARLGVLTRR